MIIRLRLLFRKLLCLALGHRYRRRITVSAENTVEFTECRRCCRLEDIRASRKTARGNGAS